MPTVVDPAYGSATGCSDEDFAAYRPWFLAAGLYNLVAGTLIALLPLRTLGALGLLPAPYPPLWQVVGMFVLVFALGYLWAWRRPYAFRHYILIGFVGKVLGPLGFLVSWAAGTLPASFGVLVVFNDLIWLPAFGAFLLRVTRQCGGWRALVAGR